jgi:hypothetical protein
MIGQRVSRVAAFIGYAAIGFAIMLVVLISYLTLTPTPVLRVLNQPLPITPSTVKPGDIIRAKFNYCKQRDLTSHIQIDLIGDYILPSLSSQRHFPIGCHEKDLAITVPLSAPAGKYNLHFSIEYQVNSLHQETYEFSSQNFTVKN